MHSPCRPVVADSRPSQSSAHRVRIAESERSIPAQHDRVKWLFSDPPEGRDASRLNVQFKGELGRKQHDGPRRYRSQSRPQAGRPSTLLGCERAPLAKRSRRLGGVVHRCRLDGEQQPVCQAVACGRLR